jgi:hypothetical protein
MDMPLREDVDRAAGAATATIAATHARASTVLRPPDAMV